MQSPSLPARLAARAALLCAASLAPLLCAAPAAPSPAGAPARIIISLRHPKLVNEDLGRLFKGVPESAVARMGLEQLAAFGYPEFSEIAPGSNIAVVLNMDDLAGRPAGRVDVVGFARLKEEGTLWNLLAAQHMVIRRRGDWALIAESAAVIDRLPDPDGVIRALEKPQDEDLKLTLSPSRKATEHALRDLRARIAARRPAPSPRALAAADAYFATIASLVDQVRTVEATLSFAPEGVRETVHAAFVPGSPLGRFTSAPLGQNPAMASRVSGAGFITGVVRQNPGANIEFTDWLLNSLIAVDYPPVSARLKAIKGPMDAYMACFGGDTAMTFDLVVGHGGAVDKVNGAYLAVSSGHFDPAVVRANQEATEALVDYTPRVLGLLGGIFSPQFKLPEEAMRHAHVKDAVVIDGVPFDSYAVSVYISGKKFDEKTTYLGVVNGSVVVANNEDALASAVPALRAAGEIPDAIHIELKQGEMSRLELNGSRLVDFVEEAGKLDSNDPDIAAQLKSLRGEYEAAGPVTLSIGAGDSALGGTLLIPYGDIEGTIHLAAYTKARAPKVMALFFPRQPVPRRHAPVAAPGPVPSGGEKKPVQGE